MALLKPGPDVLIGANAHNARRKFWLVDEYGARVSITGYAFRYRIYLRTRTAADVNLDTKLGEASGVISAAASGEFYFDFTTTQTTLAAGPYAAELVAWSSGVVTDPPTERWRGYFTVEERLETP